MNFRDIIHTVLDLGFLVIAALLILRMLGYQVGKQEPQSDQPRQTPHTRYRVHDPEDYS